MPNTNPETGIRYTVYSMRSLNPDMYQELWYGSQAVDLTYEAAYRDALEEAKLDAKREAEGNNEEFNADDFAAEFECPDLEIDEHDIEGTYEGVHYQISHLGGGELLWVLESPHTGEFKLCSPCCPGACDGDSPYVGGYSGYAVPAEWLRKDL